MAQIILLRALVQCDLELYRHELAGVLLNQDKADAEIGDMSQFLTGQVVVPFPGGQPAVPIEVAFDVGLECEVVASVIDLEGLRTELL